MSEMVERVARAIYETEPYEVSATGEMPWTDVHESQKEGFRIKARAAIEAMREPTQAMIEAGASGSGEDSEATAVGAWEAMIDEALHPTPAEPS